MLSWDAHYGKGNSVGRRTVLKGIGAAGASLLAAAGMSGSASAVGQSACLQFYHTDWTEVQNHVSDIASAGFDSIQLPPAHHARLTRADQDNDHHPPLGYQPINFKSFDSVFGTEAEFSNLVDAAHDAGLDVIADAVMNHMADGMGYDFPHFSSSDFHHNGTLGEDEYGDDWKVENKDLLGLPDLKQESSYVRGQLQDYVDKYASLGVDGVRWDAAKHIPEWFFRDYANPWADEHDLYKVGEVLHGAVSYDQGYADTGMTVTDYALYYTMKEDVFHQNGDMTALDGAGLVNQDPFHSMTFVSNHDSDPPQYHKLAYAYILTYEGYPRVYHKDVPYTDSDIQNLLWIRNNLAGGPAVTRQVDADTYVYEREGNVLVGLNRSNSRRERQFSTSWTNTELEDYTGNNGDNFTTDGNGTVTIWIPPTGWVCYAPA